ncbi:MAG TPA: DUF6144 family protein [Armatimonadota bacterium]|nr:DUF6144 family protein [Armatimonadota bacterium]
MGKQSRIEIMKEAIEQHAGEAVCREVMQGSESATTPVKRASWVKGAMERLDSLADESTRMAVMAQCGQQCAWRGYAKKIAGVKKTARTFAELLDGIAQFWHIELGEDVIYLMYPQCYCGMVSAAKEPISSTYCLCSREFLVQAFSVGLGRNVQVDIVHTIMQGAPECRFAVHISPEQW